MGAVRLLTGEAILDRMLEVAGYRPRHLRRAFRRVAEALDAETPARTRTFRDGTVETIEGSADHAIRLRAAEDLAGWVGLTPARKLSEAPDPALAVAAIAVNLSVTQEVPAEAGTPGPRVNYRHLRLASPPAPASSNGHEVS